VIDTGVDLSHPDLVANLITGYDFVGDDNQPQDGNGHGSNVAGIVAAALNGLGVVGVAPNVRLLPVKVLSDDGSGSMSDVIDGIVFAADRANILNLSLGGTSSSQSLLDAVKYATNKGRLVVASGGNCGDPNTYALNGCSSVNQPLYPGAYSQVMAVAAVTSNDTRAAFSNQNNTIDISAPGVSIYNTYRNGGYAAYSGTSQAAPHVSGQAGLIWSHQRSFTATQVRAAIESSAIDLGAAGWDPSYGWGRIDVMAAISMQVIDFQQAKSDAADPSDPTEDRTAAIQPGSVLVKFNTQTTQAQIENLINTIPGAEIIDSIDAIGWSVLGVTPGSEWRTVELLRALPEVAYAEPDFLLQLIP
jgi:thermitase